jgi:hypothetical protein
VDLQRRLRHAGHGRLRLDPEGGQADPVHDLEVEGAAQQGRNRLRLDPVEHHPHLAALLQPAPQGRCDCRLVDQPTGGDDAMVDAVEGLGRRRHGAEVDHADLLRQAANHAEGMREAEGLFVGGLGLGQLPESEILLRIALEHQGRERLALVVDHPAGAGVALGRGVNLDVLAAGAVVQPRANLAAHLASLGAGRADQRPGDKRRAGGHPHVPAVLHVLLAFIENEDAGQAVLVREVGQGEVKRPPALRHRLAQAAGAGDEQTKLLRPGILRGRGRRQGKPQSQARGEAAQKGSRPKA